MRYAFFLLVTLSLLLPQALLAQSGAPVQIDTYSLRIDGRTVEVLFRVTDRTTGRDLQGLQPRDLRLIEDNQVLPTFFELTETSTDATNPLRTVDLPPAPSGALPVNGSRALDLYVVGSTIGIVFDASLLTNVTGDPTDYVARGRELIIQFLEAGRSIAPSNPEQIGLFLPLSVPTVGGEQVRLNELPGFVQDRNAVINALNQMVPRSGKTNIFDTVGVAVTATAEAAAQRGADAYLLVITDGGDAASVGSFDALISEANNRKVKVLVLGVGSQERLARNAATLTTLASRTGGAYLGNPNPQAVQTFYSSSVTVVGQSGYVLRYTTDLIDDGKPHSLRIGVDGPGRGESQPIPLQLNSGMIDPFDLSTVLRAYLLRAGALTVVVSLVLTALLVLFKRIGKSGSRSLTGGMTRT